MSTSTGFILGILLIVVGLSFALLAYAAYLYRTDEDSDEEESDVSEESQEESAAHEEDETAEDESESAEVEPTASLPGKITAAGITNEALAEIPNQQAQPPAEAQTITLSRNENNGQLIVKVGENTYTSAEELKVSPDWIRVSYFTQDLSRWVDHQPTDIPSGSPPDSQVANETNSESMIEQIDQILSKKLEDYPQDSGRVRLTSGPDGAVKVYIGIDSYSLDEVPDPEIRALIQEAVQEWEDQ